MNTRLLFGLLWLTPTLCFGALSTDTSYFLNVEALTNVTARSAVRGLTGVFTNGVTSASLTSTGYVQSPVPYFSPVPALGTSVAASEINTSTYDAFGSMVMTPSGILILFYRSGASHVGPGDFATIQKRTSVDMGKTWSAASTVVSVASRDARNQSAGIAPDGSINLAYAIYNPGVSAFESMQTIRSTDDGATWSSPVAFSAGANTTFSPYGDIIQIADGKIGLPWYGSSGTTYNTYFATSSDNGLTWSASVVVATATGGAQWTEASYVYVNGNSIIGLVRDNAGTTFTQYRSTDNGATWASQGATSFDSFAVSGPATIVPYISNGTLALACYYQDRTEGKIRVVYGLASEVYSGPANWNLASVTFIANITAGGSGYIAAVHPYGAANGVVSWYSEKSSSDADLNFAAVIAPQVYAPSVYTMTGTAGVSMWQLFPSEGGHVKLIDNATSGVLPSLDLLGAGLNGFGGSIIGRVPTANDTLALTGGAVMLDARQGTATSPTTAANSHIFRNGSTVQGVVTFDRKWGMGGAADTGPNSTLHVAGSFARGSAFGGNATLGATNFYYGITVDAATVTLQTAVGVRDREYLVKVLAPATSGTVATTSSQLIDGATTYSLSASNKFVNVKSDGTNWWIIGNN